MPGKSFPTKLSSAITRQLFNDIDCVMTDCDGVLWRGVEAIPGAADAINKLRSQGKRILFVTNNSSKSRAGYLERFTALGVKAYKEEIICTAYTAALYLKELLKDSGKVYLIGNPAIVEELDLLGIKHTGCEARQLPGGPADWAHIKLDPEVNCVLVGFCSTFNFSSMVEATAYLGNPECAFIATNTDACLPTPGHSLPGTGSIVAAVQTASEREPIVLGKPRAPIFDVVKKLYNPNPERTLMIGDRLETDIALAGNCGLKSLLVLSGHHKLVNVEQCFAKTEATSQNQIPDFYTPSLKDLLEWL